MKVLSCSAGLRLSPHLFSLKIKKEVKTIAKQDLFINDEIRVREVPLIGLDGRTIGVLNR